MCSAVLPALLHLCRFFHQSRKLVSSYNSFDFIGFSGSLKGSDAKVGLVVMSSPKARAGCLKDYFCFIGFITPF